MSSNIFPEDFDFSKFVESIKKALGIDDTFGKPVVLFDKLKEWGRKAGRATCRPAIVLFYTMKDGDISTSDKALIYSCLAYLVLLIKIFRFIPFADLLGKALSLGVVIQKMRSYITPEIEAKADALVEKWFGAEPSETVEEILLIEK